MCLGSNQVSNCDPGVTRRLVPRGVASPEADAYLEDMACRWVGEEAPSAPADQAPRSSTSSSTSTSTGTSTGSGAPSDQATPSAGAAAGTAKGSGDGNCMALRSFIHLHAGIDALGLPASCSADFPAQWAVVRAWDWPGDPGTGAFGGVEAPRNVVLVSVPSLIDPGLAPEGTHVLHAYVPATERYEDWAGLDRGSAAYAAKKADAEAFLWAAVEEYIPGARGRAVPGTVQVGTPLTHERFLRRSRGSYGPRAVAGSPHTLPGHRTPLEGLWLCGDYTFPGIGVPAAASSGAIVANSLVGLGKHLGNLGKLRLP